MVFLDADAVSAVAFARAVRDGVARALTVREALPADVAASAALRARACAWLVPTGAALSGVSALWIWGLVPGALPRDVEVSVIRGANPSCPAARAHGYRWRSVTDSRACTEAQTIGDVRVVSVEHAVVGALRRGELALALPAAMAALDQDPPLRERVETLIGSAPPRGEGALRLASAWKALGEATQRCLREPVMRRAS